MDSLRADRLGIYGNPLPTSPRIDRLAREGAYFTRFYANGAWTSPGINSLLTSLYPPVHGVEVHGPVVNPALDLPTKVLERHGWRIYGYAYHEPNYANFGFQGEVDRDPLKFLDRQAREGSGPFFVWHHIRKTHLPYNPKPPYDTLFFPPGVSLDAAARSRLGPFLTQNYVHRGTFAPFPGDAPVLKALYDGLVREDDDEIGAILDHLKEVGLDASTIVVVTADHGEEILDHGFVGHPSTTLSSAPHEELLHVPLVLRVPGRAFPVQRVEGFAEQVDVLPTLLDLVGIPERGVSEGTSLVPLLLGQGGGKRAVFASTAPCGWNCDAAHREDRFYTVRTEDARLIYGRTPSSESFEFYDLKADPGETKDLAPGAPERMRPLVDALGGWLLQCRWEVARRGSSVPFAP